jgi:ubiquinone/menaquinone biosynthesis C-methylase UbiE
MISYFLKLPFVKRLVLWLFKARGQDVFSQIQPYVGSGLSILDVGVGVGDVTLAMKRAGNTVTALDVVDLSCTPLVKPMLYDGRTMPFVDDSFDLATIITTLHHAPDPDRVLAEAARVARRIILMEDVIYSTSHKYATFFMDSLLNLEFFGHPHSNKSDEQWKATFARLGLTLVEEKAHQSFLVMRHKTYVLER